MLLILSKFKGIDFKFKGFQICLILEAKFGEDLLSIFRDLNKFKVSFTNLNKFKVSLLQEEATKTESIDFIGCYPTRLKPGFHSFATFFT